MENKTVNKKQIPPFLMLTTISVIAAIVLAATNMVTKGPIQEHAMKALRESFAAVMPAEVYEEITVPEGYDVKSLYAAKNGDELVGYCVSAVKSGYAGDMAVTLGLDPDGVVTGCVVGDNNFVETQGFGSRARDAAFQDQFKGISAIDGGAFDALSGATVTSTAVLNATNNALKCVAEVAMGKTQAAAVEFGAPKAPAAPAAPALTGAVQSGTAKGFQSEVKVSITLDENGAVSGIQIDSMGETAGFGTRCTEEAAFAEQFIGKTGPFAIGDGIDALSGATVTSNAVVEALNNALTAPASALEALVGKAQGFQSEVTVTVTMDGDVISSVTVDSTGETVGFGTRCGEDAAFLAQFAGKTLPLESIDVLSGATVTSNAVLQAINAAAPVEPAEETPAAPAGNPVTVSGQGFQSAVEVTAYVDEAGVITAIEINSGNETPGFGTRYAEDEAFKAQFIGKALPLTETVDVLSGATVTSNAIITALQSLELAPAEEATATDLGGEVIEVPVTEGRTGEGKAQGFQSEVAVVVTVDENDVITAIEVKSGTETPGFGTRCAEDEAFLAQFIGKTFPVDGIDVLSGATVTSNAVLTAVNGAFPASGEAIVEEAPAEEAPAVDYANKDVTGTAKGFQSDVIVKVTTDAEGKIKSIVVNANGETVGLGTLTMTNKDFQAQFPGLALPLNADEIDVVAGATVTSKAIAEAINNAFAN